MTYLKSGRSFLLAALAAGRRPPGVTGEGEAAIAPAAPAPEAGLVEGLDDDLATEHGPGLSPQTPS